MFELAFAAYLVFLLPARQLWKSLRPKKPNAAEARTARYRRSIRWIASLLLIMVAVMVLSDRSAVDIGLDLPISRYGQWGLLFCALLFTIPFGWTWVLERAGKGEEKNDAYLAKIRDNEMIPRAPRELALFMVLSLLLGFGWELLYRGFLMLVLPPVTGTVGAVILTSLAYGIGHGFQGWGQIIGSIVSAFLFTLAYVLTGSLWWLMVLHAALPLFMGISGYRALKAAGELAPKAA